jgi:signal transduction histidine kinase
MAKGKERPPMGANAQPLVGTAALSLCILAIITALLPMVVPAAPQWPPLVTILVLVTAAIYGSAYLLYRNGRVGLARTLVLASVIAGVWSPIVVPGTIDPVGGHRAFVVIGILVAAALLSAAATAVVALLSLLGLATIAFLDPSYTAKPFTEDLLVNATAGAFLVAITMTREHTNNALRDERQALHAALQERETLIANVRDGVVLLDAQGAPRISNATAAAWAWHWLQVHLDKQRPLDAQLAARLPPPARAHLRAIMAHAAAGQTMTQELNFETPDGVVALRVSVLPVQASGGAVLHVQDITRMRDDEKMRQQAFEAELELQKMRDQDRFRTQLLNTAGHELRTPLTPLRMIVAMLKSGRHGPLQEQQRGDVEVLDRNVRRLGHLVDDLLDVSRLESGTVRLRHAPTDFTTLVREEVAAYATVAEEQGVQLQLDLCPPLQVECDRLRIGQVLSNLLSNALKFTPPGGCVRVHMHVEADGVTVHVQDSGAGIEPRLMPELFRPFVRLHEDRGAIPGSGLGLYISRGIVAAHGGQLRASSDGEGKGATFSLSLPTRPLAKTPGAKAEAATPWIAPDAPGPSWIRPELPEPPQRQDTPQRRPRPSERPSLADGSRPARHPTAHSWRTSAGNRGHHPSEAATPPATPRPEPLTR